MIIYTTNARLLIFLWSCNTSSHKASNRT